MGAHDRRPAPQPAVGGRPAVLRDPVLPGAGHRDGLHRRQDVGHPPARRRRRLPRGALDPQPRRKTDGRRGAHRGGLRLRRPLRGQGRPEEEGRVLHAHRRRQAGPRLPSRDLCARDVGLGDRGLRRGRARPHVRRPRGASRRVDDRPARDARPRRRRHDRRRAQIRAARQEGDPQHGAQPRQVARRRAEPRLRLGPAEADVPSAASSILPPCASRRWRCPATTCRPPGCPGS